MSLAYETTLEDVCAWHREVLKRPAMVRTIAKQRVIYAFAAAIIMGAVCQHLMKTSTAGALGAVFFFGAVWLTAGRTLRQRVQEALRKRVEQDPTSAAIGPHTLELTGEGLTETSRFQTVSHRWEAVREMTETPDLILIWVSGNGAYIVPKRSFATDAERTAFVATVRGSCPPGPDAHGS